MSLLDALKQRQMGATSPVGNTTSNGSGLLDALRKRQMQGVSSVGAYSAPALAEEEKEDEEEKNKGGFLGGLGYFFEKIGAGFMQGIEGIVDYTVGGVAELLGAAGVEGADEYAEYVFESDWMNYNHADDWYNPSEGWKVAGDVAGGIGSSLPGIAAGVAVTLATGGSGAAMGVGLATSGLAAAGTSTKEAFRESGELGGKEFGYGALMGGVEAGTEALSGALGAGLGKSIKAVGTTFGKTAGRVAGKTVGKTVGKTAVKAASKGVQSLTLKSVAKQAGKEFISEAFEEGFAEIVSPYAKRLTYDPNAKSATVEEVLYAATIGGISGVLMGGARGGFTQAVNNVRGNSIVKQGGEAEVMALAKQMIDDDAGGEYTPAIKQIYERLSPAIESGAELTGEQRRALGELKTYQTANIMQGAAARSAIAAVKGADAIAARLNADGRYKMVDGKFTFVEDASTIKKGATVREITAEDITKGYDPNVKGSINKALKSNDVLRYVASADAAGRFIMSAKEVENAALSGNKIKTQADLNNFIETASEEKKAAVGRELGITDWNTLNIDGLNEKISAYRESGKAEAYKQKIAKIDEIKAKAESKARSIPKAISISDGAVQRYADADSNIAVARTGDSFILYDYTSGNVSKDMTRAEVNAALGRYRQATEAKAAPAAQAANAAQRAATVNPNVQTTASGNITSDIANVIPQTANATTDTTGAVGARVGTSEAAAEVKSENASTNENLSSEAKNSQNGTEIEIKDEKISKSEAEAKEFDALATEKVKGYDKLSAADKSMIRKIFREARATGISEADALSYARVAARTGLDVQFNKQECYKGKNEAGEDVYHAGFYDPENNRIVVNPETNKKHTVLLIHELSHAMRSYLTKGGEYKYFIDEDTKVSKELWDEIKKYYADENGKLDTELALDEASAYYAEALYGTEGAIDLLLGEKPTLKQKILSFFAKSAEYYSTDEKLSREARRHFKKFKAMFDSFALRNTVRSTDAVVVGGKASRRASFSSIAFSFYGVDNMTAAEFEAKDYKKTEGYKAYVDECLNNMRQTQKSFDEKKSRKYIEDSIDGIVSVAVAMKKAGYDIADTAEQRSAKDTKDRLLFSSLEPNSDYFTSSDISTICDKRQNFAEIYDEIVKAEEAKGVPKGKRFFDNVDNYFYIHKVLADKGLTQPCRQCYVESMRKNLAPMANAFLTLVQESDGNNTKNAQLYNQSGKDKGKLKSNNATTREEVRKILDGYGFSPDKLTVKMLTTADGLAEIKLTMPELYERFNSFYGQSKPKMPKGATPFRFGELTALLTDNKGRIKEGLVKKINSTGGFRLQSYSDFQTKNYADVLQVLFEASTLGLNGHAYTKVPAFLDATADTNLKRNISIFMYNDGGKWKIDRNDSFPYTLEQIYDVVKADKSGNTGIIAVVQNEDMAAYVMANDNIGYFIPFHKSGIKMGVVRETTVKEGGREIKGYKNIKDHTRQQTEVWAKTTEEHKANTKVSNPINIYEEGLWDFENADGLSRNELIKKNVKAYIDECEKRGYLPKFREYVMNNEKVLNSVLSYAKELGTVAETATVDDISFEYKGYRIPYGYYKCLGDFSMITPDGKASGIEPLSLENYKFDKAVKYFSDAESVRRNEILQQFANGNEREYYRESTMTAEELQKVIDTKRTEVVNEIVGKSARRASAEGISNTSADIEASSEAGDAASADVGLPRRAGRTSMTVGQLKKLKANYTRQKTYSRKDAISVVGKIDAGSVLSENVRNDIAESIWQIYNEALTREEREAAAYDIAKYFTLKLFSESKVENPDAKKAQEDLVYLSAGIGRLTFTTEQMNEIKHRMDKDGANSIRGRWGYKGDKKKANGITVGRLPLETFVVDIAREMPGMEYLEDMNPIDAFLEIDTVYKATREIALDKEISAYWDVPESGFEDIVKSIQNDIMQGYIDTGSKSKFATMFEARIEYYQKRAERFQKDFEEIRGRDKINGMLVNQALRMRDLKIGKFKNATQDQNDIFKKSIETLSRVQWRGNISVKSTRKAVKALYEWYKNEDVKKGLFGYVDKDNIGRYNEGIAAIMEELSKDENKTFSKVELNAMLEVMSYFTNFVETFGKVWRRGQWIDAEGEAKRFISVIPSASKQRRGVGKITKNLTDKYLATFADPETVIRRMDNYEDGFYTEMFEDLREAAINAGIAEIDILADYEEFVKKNKHYLEKAKTETVKYNGVEIPKIDLISLYMTLRDEQSRAGFAINGFDIRHKDGKTTRVPGGLSATETHSAEDVKGYVLSQMSEIEKLFTDTDREYMKILERGYVKAGEAKAYRDTQKYGFTNVSGNYYYPIRRANIASNVDKSEIQEELDRVSNASFNKDRVKGAKQELFIEDADKLFRKHVHAVCQYANLSPVIDSYNMLYNYDVSGNPNHPISIRTQSQNVWTEGDRYFRKLISDVQGITATQGAVSKALSAIRSNYAKFQLGANPKTWVSQLSSMFAASSVLDVGRIFKSTGISSKDADAYSKVARLRHYDDAAAKAQAVADNKIGAKKDSITDIAMKPISGVDNFVIHRLFAACQSQIQADTGEKIGTEQNKILAGKLLDRVILETQQNSLATEKSAAMRSGNEFYKAITMFRADAMKVIGRVIDSYGEVKSIKQKIKAEKKNANAEQSAKNIEELKKRLSAARKKAAKATYGLAMTSIFTALVAQGFKWLYAKERDEDETFVEDTVYDIIGNMFGGLPIITDAYNYFVEGFDVENYSYTAINDFLASTQNIINMFDGDTSSQEVARGIKNLTYSLGQLSGVPTRNLYNVFYGLTKRISPETGYSIDSVFYEKNYKNDFYKAIQNEDEDMAEYILQLLVEERLSDNMGDSTYNAILSLSKDGYKILPKTVPDKITVDGVEYELDETQIDGVKKLYNQYIKGAESFINSYYYQSLGKDSKYEAITYYFDLSRDRAISEALDVDRGKKAMIADLVGMDALTKLHIATKGIESDVDKQGNTIAGSKKKKVLKAIKKVGGSKSQQVLMLYALGYTVQDGDIKGVSASNAKKLLLNAIMKLNVSKEEKAEIAKSFGFTVKNGKILKN
jgi:hypothetical protein